MTAARTFSPSFNAIVETANAALERADGLTANFLISKYGSMDAAATAARSFQVSFCSLRARARRRNMVNRGEAYARDSDARGIYDALICQRNRLPDNLGWFVFLGPASAVADEFEIIDNATGERVYPGGDRTLARVQYLMPFVMKRTLSASQWDELEAMQPNWPSVMGMRPYPRPEGGPSTPPPPSQNFDLADDCLATDTEEEG